MEHTLRLNDDELRIVQMAMRSFVKDFGHEEMDVLRPAKALLGRLEEEARTPVGSGADSGGR